VGQGTEGDHNVWRGIEYSQLAGIRIASVSSAAGLRIEAEAAAAYPSKTGLARFRRTLSLDGAGTFTVSDDIGLSRPGSVQWYLHTDDPLEPRGAGWVSSAKGGPALSVTVQQPEKPRATVGETRVAAPGQPGSITKGTVERRGYELRLDSPPALWHRFLVVLAVEPASR